MKSRSAKHSHPLPMRLGALALALCLLWSLGLAGAARAMTLCPRGHTRPLSPAEMAHIIGAQISGGGGGTGGAAIGPAPGGTFGWQASVNGTNTANGNKLTHLPLVSWTARGGLPVAFTLSHNSQASTNADLGRKWTCSYDIRLAPGGASMDTEPYPTYQYLTVVWGDDQALK